MPAQEKSVTFTVAAGRPDDGRRIRERYHRPKPLNYSRSVLSGPTPVMHHVQRMNLV